MTADSDATQLDNVRTVKEHRSEKHRQSLFIVRHGDRWDYSHPNWRVTAARVGDPPLSDLGHAQAAETGIFLDKLFFADGITAKNLTVLSSPFLRCVETANDIVKHFRKVREDAVNEVKIYPEYSVWEMDGNHNGVLHKDLPSLKERKCYFPRLETTHESLFVPTLPETKIECLERCERVIAALNKRYPYELEGENEAIVIVTHAAACIALAKAAAGRSLAEVNPAGPCAVFRLDRVNNDEKWDMDHFSKVGGMNGHLGHLSEVGQFTVPWNNFGPDSGYTGPAQNRN